MLAGRRVSGEPTLPFLFQFFCWGAEAKPGAQAQAERATLDRTRARGAVIVALSPFRDGVSPRRVFSIDPREIWHFIRQFLGESGSWCDRDPNEISSHFCDVDKPPDYPDFCMSCLNDAERWIEANIRTGSETHAVVPELPDQLHFSTLEATEGFKQLKSCA